MLSCFCDQLIAHHGQLSLLTMGSKLLPYLLRCRYSHSWLPPIVYGEALVGLLSGIYRGFLEAILTVQSIAIICIRCKTLCNVSSALHMFLRGCGSQLKLAKTSFFVFPESCSFSYLVGLVVLYATSDPFLYFPHCSLMS